MKFSSRQHYDVIVIGSGPGGASVARELARGGKKVLVLERGSAAAIDGTLLQMAKMAAILGKGAFFNRDASLLVQGIAAGGSSVINFATAIAPPLAMFAAYKIDLQAALRYMQTQIPMVVLPDALIGPMAKRLMQTARTLGHDWNKFDKMIYVDQCRTGCWRCAYGCPFGAKWTARDFLNEAMADGAELLANAQVRRILIKNDRAIGVEFTHQNQTHSVFAENIVLAAGGIASPQLMYASGLLAVGATHFSDPVVAVMGSVEDISSDAEVPMAAGMHLEKEGIMLADLTLPRPMYQAFALQVGRLDRLFFHSNTLTTMVKIRDQIGGKIGPRWVNKALQPSDRQKFAQGIEIATDILKHAGAKHIFKSWHFAAHPGGSIRIGQGVDHHLQSHTQNLYVCDASVIPEEWGLPPTLTLLCLGKRLAEHLI